MRCGILWLCRFSRSTPISTMMIAGPATRLVRGNSFRIIDHELAFRIKQKLFPKPEPWRAGYLERFIGADGHIFGNGLRSRNHDLGPIRGTWSGLSDARFEEYRGLLPAEWESARPAWDAALTHLRTVLDRIEYCIA